MKAQLIKPPPLREQLKAIANPATKSSKILHKQPSKPKRSPKQRKPKAPRNPTITEMIERLAEGIETLEEIFK